MKKDQDKPPIFDEITILPDEQTIYLPESGITGECVSYLSQQSQFEICLTTDNLSQGIVGVHKLGNSLNLSYKEAAFLYRYYFNNSALGRIEPDPENTHRWKIYTEDIDNIIIPQKDIFPLQIHTIEKDTESGEHILTISVRDSLYLYCPTCASALSSEAASIRTHPDSTVRCTYCQYKCNCRDHLESVSTVSLPNLNRIEFKTF